MSDLEARIAEVLAGHMDGKYTFAGIATNHEHLMTVRCACGWFEVNVPFQKIPLAGVWQAHVSEYTAAMLAPVIREREAKALREAADDKALRLSGHSGISITRLRARADNLAGS